jgi:hypothetical protein
MLIKTLNSQPDVTFHCHTKIPIKNTIHIKTTTVAKILRHNKDQKTIIKNLKSSQQSIVRSGI